MKKNILKEKEYTSFQFKIPNNLYDEFRVKSIRDKCPTYRDKIIELIEEYVKA